MISSLLGNPRSALLAKKWQPQKHHSEHNQSNASPARDAISNRE
jgi:hypothetical protein